MKSKVVLGGDSADELLAGYDTFKAIKYLKIITPRSYKELYILHKSSAATLLTEYGFRQSLLIFSFSGGVFFRP